MEKDAIQTDVSNEGEGDEEKAKPTPELNPNNEYRDDLAAQFRLKRNQEVGVQVDEDQDDDGKEEDQEQEQDDDEAIPAAAESQDDDEEEVQLHVDGKEVNVPKSKVYDTGVRALQKELTADQRLAEATQMRQEAEQILNKAKESPAESSSDDGEELRNIVEKIQFGTKEEGFEAMQELVGNLKGKTDQDPKALASTIKDMMSYEQAVEYVNDEYSDVMSDPILAGYFGQRENELRDSGDTRPYKELYKAIGNEIRDWKNGLKPTKTGGLQDRKDRKSAMPKHVGGGTVAPIKDDAPKPKTRADVIEEMRAARHQV